MQPNGALERAVLATWRLDSAGCRHSIHLLCGEEHGLAEGVEELLIGLRVFNGAEAELGTGANQQLSRPARSPGTPNGSASR